MSRDLRRENAHLRAKLRDSQTRLRLLASAVLAGDQAAKPLAELLLAGNLNTDGASQEPPSPPSGEPGARSPSAQGAAPP